MRIKFPPKSSAVAGRAHAMTREMVRYYARRAPEYERIYQFPDWRRDVEQLTRLVPEFFQGRRVFEVACGTGYWTWYAALGAASLCATDVNEETLALARSRSYGDVPVELLRADAYAPSPGRRPFDAGLAAFWLSHVNQARMEEFFTALHSWLEPGASVMMFDEHEAGSKRLPESRTDAAGNRYEMRKLQNDERFEIVKNFYSEVRLTTLLAGRAADIRYRTLDNFWLLTYRAA